MKQITTLIVCSKHVSLIRKPAELMLQSYCETHGRFGSYHKNLTVPCPQCAYLRGVCQICGGLITKDDLDLWHDEQGTPVPKGKSRVYL